MITRWIIFNSSFALVSVNVPRKVDRSRGTFCIHIPLYMYVHTWHIATARLPLLCAFIVYYPLTSPPLRWLFSHSLKDAARYIIPDLRSSIIRKGMEMYSECIFCENTFARSCDECPPSQRLTRSRMHENRISSMMNSQRGRTEKTKGEKRFIYTGDIYLELSSERHVERSHKRIPFFSSSFSLS